MAITVKHKFVSAIPDAGDPTIVQPSNWNDDHQLTGTIPVANGGTGASTANDGFNALAPVQTGNSGKFLTTDGTNSSWATNPLGTVTSVGSGTGLTGGPITTSGTLSIASTGVTAATYGSASVVPVIAINAQGQITSSTNTTIAIANTQVSGLGTMSTQNANAIAVTGGTIDGTSIGATTPSTGAFSYVSTNSVTSTTPSLSFNGSNTNLASGAIVSGSYLQNILQNKSGTANASTNYVLSNDLGTDSTYYGEFGMNSSVFSSGTPADFFSINNGVYFSAHDGDITVGSGNGYKTYFAWGTSGNHAHVINASGAIGLDTSITGATNFGTAGQVLTSGGSGATPTWTTPTTGTVTSVSGTAGRITSTGGNTPVIDLASGIATAGTTGSSTLIPVVTIDTYGRVTSITTASNPQGTVTSVAALTLGTTGTDLSSSVATGTTTPVITLNVPTASATNRGALSAADWTTFNNKQPAGSYLTAVTADAPLSGSGTSGSHLVIATANTTTTGAISSTDWNTFNGKQAALVSGTNIKTVNGTTLLGSGDLGTITYAYGGTGQTTVTTGDLLYGSATNTWSKLGIGTTGQILRVVSGAPAWGTDYTGTVTSVSGTGTVNGLTLSGTVTTSGNLTLGGTLDLSSPPAIGGTAANLITGTTITATKFVGVSGGTF
jgi:hypothetical protein